MRKHVDKTTTLYRNKPHKYTHRQTNSKTILKLQSTPDKPESKIVVAINKPTNRTFVVLFFQTYLLGKQCAKKHTTTIESEKKSY